MNYYKWEAVINFLTEKKEKTRQMEKRKEKKKDHAFAWPSLELSPFILSLLSNTVYQRIELT